LTEYKIVCLYLAPEAQQAPAATAGASGTGEAIRPQNRVLNDLGNRRTGRFNHTGLTVGAVIFLFNHPEKRNLFNDVGHQANRTD